MTPAEQLALSDERDLWHRYAMDLARWMYEIGYSEGRADEARKADQAWAAAPVPRFRNEPTLAELELLRWGPGGRERFGDPRPGDRMPQPGRAA